MRTVMNTRQVMSAWANQSQDYARNSTGSVYFRGTTIYSYGEHFPMARHYYREGNQAILMTTRNYSVTTSQHKSQCRYAIMGLTQFNVPCVLSINGNVQDYAQRITDNLHKAQHARKHTKWYLEYAQDLENEARSYCAFFSLDSASIPSVKRLQYELGIIW